LALGAADYITKPISPPIVQLRGRNHLASRKVGWLWLSLGLKGEQISLSARPE
jgi:DNA-binding response OmpR family regulator